MERTIEVLNTLITINNDRIEGYETASKETKEQDLKTLFSQLAQTSRKCKQSLESEVNRLGGQPSEGTKISGKFFRVWMDVKAALTSKDRKAILSSCEFGEDAAVHTYENVIKNEAEQLSSGEQDMVREQFALIKADHDKIKCMRDELVEA